MPAQKPDRSETPSSFAQFNFAPELFSQLTQLELLRPTDIQQHAIPILLAGGDLIAQSATGSGKTAAFGLPLLQKLVSLRPARKVGRANTIGALIVVPTRELASQVAQMLQQYSLQLQLKILAVYGGVSINPQMLALRGGCDVLVATPGRLLDLVDKNALTLDMLHTLVLDEADRLLSLGFSEELQGIKRLLPVKHQTALFSATFPQEVLTLAQQWLCSPTELLQQQTQVSALLQRVVEVNQTNKKAALVRLLKDNSWSQVLIFVSAKKSAERLKVKLEKQQIKAQVFHGDKSQGNRERVLSQFKSGELPILIATDIAARGIDIEHLPVVINFELPRSPADYQHRIGRSARAGRSGVAISLISPLDYHHFSIIEKKNKLSLAREQLIGLEVDDALDVVSEPSKVVIPAAGMGKKKRKKANADIWARNNAASGKS